MRMGFNNERETIGYFGLAPFALIVTVGRCVLLSSVPIVKRLGTLAHLLRFDSDSGALCSSVFSTNRDTIGYFGLARFALIVTVGRCVLLSSVPIVTLEFSSSPSVLRLLRLELKVVNKRVNYNQPWLTCMS